MFVCICNNLQDDVLSQAKKQGCKTSKDFFKWLGKRPNCKTCCKFISQELK